MVKDRKKDGTLIINRENGGERYRIERMADR